MISAWWLLLVIPWTLFVYRKSFIAGVQWDTALWLRTISRHSRQAGGAAQAASLMQDILNDRNAN